MGKNNYLRKNIFAESFTINNLAALHSFLLLQTKYLDEAESVAVDSWER
jgi:hypothetical protein